MTNRKERLSCGCSVADPMTVRSIGSVMIVTFTLTGKRARRSLVVTILVATLIIVTFTAASS